MAQKIPVFANDSFSRTLTQKEIRAYFSYQKVVQISDGNYPDDPYNVIDSVINIEMNPEEDFKGFRISYKPQINVADGQISYSPFGIGPLYMLQTSGIQLGLNYLFLLKMSDLPSVLSPNDISFITAVIAQNSQFGDFRLFTSRYYSIDSSALPFELAQRSIQVNTRFIPDNVDFKNKTKVMASFNRHVASVIMSRIATNQETNYPINECLFKDRNLGEPYIDPENELAGELITSLMDEYGTVVDTVLLVGASFFDRYDYVIWVKGRDFIFDFTIEQYGYSEDNGHIYMSFNTVKELFPKQDRIVWEAFLNDLFQE